MSGLVAITAGCGVVEKWAAVIIGVIAGWALVKFKIDDAVNAVPVHLFNGLWGVLSVRLLASPNLLLAAYGTDRNPGWFYLPNNASLLGAQVFGILFIMGWTLVTMFPFFIGAGRVGWSRRVVPWQLSSTYFTKGRKLDQ